LREPAFHPTKLHFFTPFPTLTGSNVSGQANSRVTNTNFSNELNDLAHFPDINAEKNTQAKQALEKHSESATSSLHMGFTMIQGEK
jgi:hypothetical protein